MDSDISVVPFKFSYLPMLYDMLKSQQYLDISQIRMSNLPKIGYIALLNKQPVAAGFLRRVEGGYGQIDGLTSNAYLGSIIRHQGISKVVNSLLSEAKSLRLEGVLAITKDQGVLKRGIELGFTVVEQTLLALPLK